MADELHEQLRDHAERIQSLEVTSGIHDERLDGHDDMLTQVHTTMGSLSESIKRMEISQATHNGHLIKEMVSLRTETLQAIPAEYEKQRSAEMRVSERRWSRIGIASLVVTALCALITLWALLHGAG